MKLITGTVIGGKVEVPSEAVAEGARVVVLALGTDEPVRLTPEEEEELSAAMDEIQKGEYIDADDLVQELRSRLKS